MQQDAASSRQQEGLHTWAVSSSSAASDAEGVAEANDQAAVEAPSPTQEQIRLDAGHLPSPAPVGDLTGAWFLPEAAAETGLEVTGTGAAIDEIVGAAMKWQKSEQDEAATAEPETCKQQQEEAEEEATRRMRCQQAEGAAEGALLEDVRSASLPGARVALGELTFLSKFNFAVSNVAAPGSTRLCAESAGEAKGSAAPSPASASFSAPASAADIELQDKIDVLARLQKLEQELERCQQGGNALSVANLNLAELRKLSDSQLDHLKSSIEKEKKEREHACATLEEAMLCPISLMPMHDPVVAADG